MNVFFLSFFTSNRFKKLNDFIIRPIQIGHVTNSSNCDNRLLNDSIHKISISQKKQQRVDNKYLRASLFKLK